MRRLDANAPVAAAELDGESTAAWGRELGDDFIELLVYPQSRRITRPRPNRRRRRSTMPARVGWTCRSMRCGADGRARTGGGARCGRAKPRSSGGRRRVCTGRDRPASRWCGRRRRLHDAVVVAVPARSAVTIVPPDGPVRTPSRIRNLPAAAVAFVVTADLRRLFRLRATGRGARQGCGGSVHSGAKGRRARWREVRDRGDRRRRPCHEPSRPRPTRC